MAKNIKAPLNRKISPARKLDIQVWLVILLCLGTISAMAGAMERTEPSAETELATPPPDVSELLSAMTTPPPMVHLPTLYTAPPLEEA